MGLRGIISLCVLLVAVLVENEVEGFRVTRQGNSLTVELLIVVDYSEYNKWYSKTSTSSSHAAREQEAKNNLKQYLTALIHSTNSVYRSLESHNLYVQIKLVDVLFWTTASQSNLLESIKVQDADGTSYDVDPSKILNSFIPTSQNLQSSIPHDHAMIFTQYSMKKGSGSTFAGYAKTEAECSRRSVSIVQDQETMYTAVLMAHELGHSLGCDHDGEGNSQACPVGGDYTMEASLVGHNDKKWTFSSCSANAIKVYINQLIHDNENCLNHVDNTHPDSQVITQAHEWYGQVYSYDEQCKITYGPNAYFCRDQYDGDYSLACLKFYCYDPSRDGCYWHDGGDGNPCGTGKWCMGNNCVSTTTSSIQSIAGDCVAGDQPGIVYHGRTCQEIGAGHEIDCQRSSVKYSCCQTCGSILKSQPVLSPTDIDGQCARKQGAGSYFCRTATAYDGKAYSDVVCSRMLCHDTTRDNWCLGTHIDDYTSCGYQKNCINGACVHNSSAPAVPDDCPWGDQPGVITNGLTCEQIKLPANMHRCYSDHTRTKCCAACQSVYMRKGCEYGDESTHCHASSCHTYGADKLSRCCETCRAAPIVG